MARKADLSYRYDVLRHLVSWQRIRRYITTSMISTVVSETVLLVLFGGHYTGAAAGSVVATMVGAITSYGLSRYWIWAETDRAKPMRQMVRYGMVSVAGLLVSASATHEVAIHVSLHNSMRTWLVGGAYFGVYAVLWGLKLLAYQKLVFKRDES